jgi:hypothetical protein
MSENDHYYYQSNDPHTAVPDWVPFAHQLGPEARNLITATLVLQKRGKPPTRRELAEALCVDERSIYRWLGEIASAGAMSTRRAGRRRLNVFHRPKPDRAITDRAITDQAITDRAITDRAITDRAIRYEASDSSEHACQQSHETPIPDQAISDPSVGAVGDQQSRDSDPTTTNRRPLKTPLARWMKQFGINAAAQFDDPALDYWTYRRFCEDKRAAGWAYSQLVSTLQQAPLERNLLAQPGDVIVSEGLADDQADELAHLDSTSIALARRFEADKAEAAARAWPQEGSKQ